MDTDDDDDDRPALAATPMDIQGTSPDPTTPHIADSTAGKSKRTATAMESTNDGHSPPKLVDKTSTSTTPPTPASTGDAGVYDTTHEEIGCL
jgi:hypothetical protein